MRGDSSTTLSGWGRTTRLRTTLCQPGDPTALATAIAQAPHGIARGHGRAYGDAALNATQVIGLGALNGILEFDATTGLLTAAAGLRLAELIAHVVPYGWFPPVVPGTAQVSLGGMIAADIHGKNHHGAGNIGAWVQALTLHLADGSVRDLQPGEALFAATIGGMGLTGIIGRVTLQLIRIPGAQVEQETLRATDLDAAMAIFEASAEWPYSVAWIDGLATGRALGRCVVYRGRHVSGPPIPTRRRPSVPFDTPGLLLNRWSLRAFNAAYYHAARPGLRVMGIAPFFFPLDAIGGWNRLYGRRGFHQHQCVLPLTASRAGLRAILDRASAAGLGSFLAVLKLFGAPGGTLHPDYRAGPLSFPMRGYTLALDFPNTPAALRLMDELDRIVLDHGGRLYLAKDSRQAPEMLRHYDLATFGAVRDAVDPGRRFASLQSGRLGL